MEEMNAYNKRFRTILSAFLCFALVFASYSSVNATVDGSAEENNVAIDETNFPDEVFRAYILENFDEDKNNSLSKDEVVKVDVIKINDREVETLQGIGFFTELVMLSCDNTQVSDLDLSNLTKLQSLSCDETQVSSLDLSNLTELQSLHCSNTQVSDLNLSNLAKLQILTCSNTQIRSLDLSNCFALEHLTCYSKSLEEIKFGNNASLKELFCGGPVSDLDLSGLSSLDTFYCGCNAIEQLDVSQNSNLKELWCMDMQVEELDLSNNTALEYLNFAGTKIEKVNLNGNSELKYLFCGETLLTDIDLSKNTKLVRLDCGETPLKHLDLSQNVSLEQLSCNGSKIKELQLSQNVNLEYLSCDDTEISKLDLSNNRKLKYLACEKTLISGIDLSQNVELKYLSCNEEESLVENDQTIVTGFKPNENLAWMNLGTNGELKILENSQIDITNGDESGNPYFPDNSVYLKSGEKLKSIINIRTKADSINLTEKFPGIDITKITEITGAELNNGVIRGYRSGIPVTYTYDCGEAEIGKVLLEVTLNIEKESSSGGIYIPPTPPVQKPEISAGDGYATSLSKDGTTVVITIKDGYLLEDVKINGISSGSVNTVTGLKTGDKIEVIVITKAEKIAQIKSQLETVSKENFKARSSQVKMKNGKKAFKITMLNNSGIKFDGVEIFRSMKKNIGYGTKPIFTTKSGTYYNTAIKKGKRYYYKARCYVEYDGQKYYSDWSARAWRTVR